MGNSVLHSAIEHVFESQDGIEGPIWCSEGRVLMWINGERNQVCEYDPEKNESRSYPLYLDEVAGSISLTGKPKRIIITLEKSGVVSHTLGEHRFATKECNIRKPCPTLNENKNRFNIGTCDHKGRLLFGGRQRVIDDPWKEQPPESTFPSDLKRENQASGFFKLEGKKLSPLCGSVFATAQRLVFSPDSSVLYLLDGPGRAIWACGYNLCTGEIRGFPQLFYQMPAEEPGCPVDAVCDSQGHLYVAYDGGGCVRRHHSGSGEVDLIIQLPCPSLTGLVWGGPDLSKLYISGTCSTASKGSSLAIEKHQLSQDEPHAFQLGTVKGQLYSVTVTDCGQVVRGVRIPVFKTKPFPIDLDLLFRALSCGPISI